jgi:hypothetical protein
MPSGSWLAQTMHYLFGDQGWNLDTNNYTYFLYWPYYLFIYLWIIIIIVQ